MDTSSNVSYLDLPVLDFMSDMNKRLESDTDIPQGQLEVYWALVFSHQIDENDTRTVLNVLLDATL